MHSKIYSNESLMTLEGNRQAQEGLQRFSFKTQRFFQAHLWKTNWGRREPVHTESSSGNTWGPCTCWGDGDAAARGCRQSHGNTDGSAGAHGLLSHPGSVPRCWARRRRRRRRRGSCNRGAGDGRGGDGEESGTEGGSNLRVVCSNPKTEGNWVIVPLIHLITGQSSSLAR